MLYVSLDLTMNVYTGPRLLDVAGAMQALPELGLEGRGPRATLHCEQRHGE